MSYPHDPYAQKYIDDRTNNNDRREEFLAKAEKKVREARNALYVIAGLNALGAIIFFALDVNNSFALIIANLVLTLAYLILASALQKRPRLIIIIALVIFCSVWLMNIITEPEYIVRGLLIKIVIIMSLMKGYRAAAEVEDLRRQLGKMDAADEANAPLDMIR